MLHVYDPSLLTEEEQARILLVISKMRGDIAKNAERSHQRLQLISKLLQTVTDLESSSVDDREREAIRSLRISTATCYMRLGGKLG